MHKSANGTAAIMTTAKRCAIYTRKSSEEGLDQDFNSLDAQREACEAYILSQKHEGWICLCEMYDDGGISGGTLERPALKRLLDDIAAGRVDAVVVYKVDRLTRSLGDFAKIVDAFDTHSVSFVSVTQAFNTTTSMGRLTLNMLLSFAQFEREVTGERIRDKIAASKKKGLWMGGTVPLGYDVNERKLVVNDAEAETVRHIYRRYVDLGSVRVLKEALDRDGIVSKMRIDKHGKKSGGKPLARGALYLLLQNRLYRGEIVHKDESYPGEHKAIIDETLWDQVQRRLAANRVERANGTRAETVSLLAGLITDDSGRRMTPSHANKKGTRYRYYVSQALVNGVRKSAPRARRVPARDLEALVEDRLRQFLGDETEFFAAIEDCVTDVNAYGDLIARAADLGRRLPDLAPKTKRQILLNLVDRIELASEAISIRIMSRRLPAILYEADDPSENRRSEEDKEPMLTFTVPVHLKRTGIETRLLIDGADRSRRRGPDHSLLRLLGQAYRYNEMVMHSHGKSMTELASEAGVGGSYFTRVLRLSFLAPDIVNTILRDCHPIELNAKRLLSDTRLPIAWQDQRERLGIS
jgi:DNA invertase Pin-like site-specific DNA recombinase